MDRKTTAGEKLTRKSAEKILEEAYSCNPGRWREHSKWVAYCGERIAAACGMDADRAYIYGLLHDIGRKFGVSHLAHVYDGYHYLMELGFEDAAKICLTHSFNLMDINDYIGKFDVEDWKVRELENLLRETELDDYDLLIQLCDSLATWEGVVSLEERMLDVKERYGYYPQSKWERNVELKKYFEKKAGKTVEEIMR